MAVGEEVNIIGGGNETIVQTCSMHEAEQWRLRKPPYLSENHWNLQGRKVPESGTFKEESTELADFTENENKALQELKSLIQEALNKHEFPAPVNPRKEEKQETVTTEKEDSKKQPQEEQKSFESVIDVATGEPAQPTKTLF